MTDGGPETSDADAAKNSESEEESDFSEEDCDLECQCRNDVPSRYYNIFKKYFGRNTFRSINIT